MTALNQDGILQFAYTQDDLAPVTTANPTSTDGPTPLAITLTCNDTAAGSGCQNIAFTKTDDGSTPAEPQFDAGGNITTGQTYASPILAVDGKNTKIKFKARDNAGVVEAVKAENYNIDSNVATINLVSNQNDFISSIAGAKQSTNLTWDTDKVGTTWSVRYGGTNCTDGTQIATGTTPGPAGTDVVTNVDAIAPAPQLPIGAQTVRICVQNIATVWAFITKTITRDDTSATGTPSLSSGSNVTNGTQPFIITFNETMDTGTLTLGGTMIPPEAAAPAWSTTTNTNDTLTISPATTWANAAGKTLVIAAANLKDLAGNNINAISLNYNIDSVTPIVTLNSNEYASVSNDPAGFGRQTTDINFNHNRIGDNLAHTVRIGGTDCTNGSVSTHATATGNSTGGAVVTTIKASDLAPGDNTIRVCVVNFAGTFGSSTHVIKRLDEGPVYAMAAKLE